MKRTQLASKYEEWVRSIEAKETSRTYCAVDEDTWDDGIDYRLVGFGMDKNTSEVFIGTYGSFHDYGHIIMTHILDLSKKNDKKIFDNWFKEGKVIFGSWEKLRKFHF